MVVTVFELLAGASIYVAFVKLRKLGVPVLSIALNVTMATEGGLNGFFGWNLIRSREGVPATELFEKFVTDPAGETVFEPTINRT